MKKTKLLFEWKSRKKPKILYHTTTRKNLKLIFKKGLQTDYIGFIYLMEKPENWNEVLIEVTIPNSSNLMDWREAWYNDDDEEIDMDHQYDEDNPYWIYLSPISPKYLKLIKS